MDYFSTKSLSRLLDRLEHIGNKLPHPILLFTYFCVAILLLSALCASLNVSAIHPLTGQTIHAVNLLSQEGLAKILTNTVTNFTQFAPLGTVIIALLGIGIAEHSGLLATFLRLLIIKAPASLITPCVVFAGVLSSLAADSGYVVLIPLSAVVFMASGKHPIAGIAAAFAGVSGGYSANLFIGPLDAILAGISTEAAHLVAPNYTVNAASNFYFSAVSTLLITLVGTWVTERIVIPRLQPIAPDQNQLELSAQEFAPKPSPDKPSPDKLSPNEQRGLKFCGVFTLIFIGLLCLGLLPENGILRDPTNGSIVSSPFIKGIVTIIAIFFGFAGYIYSRGAQTLQEKNSVIDSMEKTMATMASYLVLMFFAAQFINYFSWTQLGLISAVQGAELLKSSHIDTVWLMLIFIFFTSTINLLIASSSANWTMIAPVFVPMFYLLGIAPETTQAAYRIGDSCTNIITPLMPYFALIVAFVQRYDKKAGMGTMIAIMLPYSVCFLISWSVLFVLWFLLGLPLGPGAALFIK